MVKNQRSLDALNQMLRNPNATDEQFIQAGDQMGPNTLGAAQWQQHANARRDQMFNDTVADTGASTDPTYDPLNMNVHEAMRSQAQSAAIDPGGVLGMFVGHSQGAFPDETAARLNPNKKKAASLAALGQVMQ